MDDIASKLSELLESPEGLESIKSMAEVLLGGAPAGDKEEKKEAGLSVSPAEVQTVMKVLTALKSGGDDDRTRLLLALRPHLSEEKRPRIDQAVKLLKLTGILPLLKDSDLLNLF